MCFKRELKKSLGRTSYSWHTGKMSTLEAGPRPVQVSPLIKFTRWTLLLAGIAYGAYHQRRLSKIENARREQELREKPMRDAKLAEEKKRQQEAEQKMMNELLNLK